MTQRRISIKVRTHNTGNQNTLITIIIITVMTRHQYRTLHKTVIIIKWIIRHQYTTQRRSQLQRPNEWTTEQRGEGHQLMKTELRDGKNYKRGVVWSSNRKRFPKWYDKGVSAMKGSGNNSMQRGTMEANNKPSTSIQWQSGRKMRCTINNIYPSDIRNELLRTDQDVERVEKQTQCPIVTVRINNCDIKLLVDTGS